MLASLDTGIAVPHLSGGVAHVALLLTRCQRFSHEILNDCSKMALGNLFSLVVWRYVQYVGDCNKCKYAVKAEIRGCPLDCSDKIAAMATYTNLFRLHHWPQTCFPLSRLPPVLGTISAQLNQS